MIPGSRLAFDEKVQARLAEALEGLPFVQFAYVFGSRARGRARPHSDLDLAVLVEEGMDLREAEKRLYAECSEVFPADRLHLVLLNQAPPLLRHRVLRDGRLLVERDPVVRVRFQVASLREYFDLEHAREMFYQARKKALKEGVPPRGRPGDPVATARRLARIPRRAAPLPKRP